MAQYSNTESFCATSITNFSNTVKNSYTKLGGFDYVSKFSNTNRVSKTKSRG